MQISFPFRGLAFLLLIHRNFILYNFFSSYGWCFIYIFCLTNQSLSQGLKNNLLYFLLRALKFLSLIFKSFPPFAVLL